MRDLALNHASLTPPNACEARKWLRDIVQGIAYLVTKQISSGEAIRVGNTAIGWLDRLVCKDGTRVIVDAQLGREECRRLRRLRERSLEFNVDPELASRLRGCQATGCHPINLNQDDGAPLLLAAFIGGIAISYPSQPAWANDQLQVQYDRLLNSVQVRRTSIGLDNLCRLTDAKSISVRHQDQLRRDTTTPTEFWERKETTYPHLKFGLEVREQLANINQGMFRTVMRNLATLNYFAAEWRNIGGPAPPWGNFVKSESEPVKSNPKHAGQREFRSAEGITQPYFWHTNISKGGRIYLRIDRATFLVEIGGITGQHLRTKRF